MVRKGALWLLGFLVLSFGGASGQTGSDLTAGVRPQKVRVGDTFVVTVRFVGAAWPEELELDVTPAVEVVDVRDRSSTGVGAGVAGFVIERDFVLRALEPGGVLPGGAWALVAGDTVRVDLPNVEAVGAPLQWASRPRQAPSRRPEEAPLDQGLPPSAGGRDADRERAPEGLWPRSPYGARVPFGAGVPYGQGVPFGSNPYGSLFGQGYPYSQGYPPGSGSPLAPGNPYGSAYPLGFGSPQGFGTPLGYGSPFGSGQPYGYGSPFGTGQGFGSGQAYGYGSPFGTEQPYSYGSPFGAQSPNGTVYPPLGGPYGPSGWGVSPDGRGWAAGAAGDPWWPELVPQLDFYESLAESAGGMVRLEAGLTPGRVYEGQQVTLVATATFAPEARARLGASPEFFPSSASNAWSVDIPYAPPSPAAVRGRVHEAHTFMRAFFPVEPGLLTVEPAGLRYVGWGSERGVRLSTR